MVNKVVVIVGVGVADGLGGALGRKFSSGKRHIVLCGRSKEKLDESVASVTNLGGSAESFVADVTSQSELRALFKHVNSNDSVLDCVIFNAGNNIPIPFEELSPEEYESYWRVGCLGGFLTAKQAMPILAKQGEGSMLFTGASASLRGRPMFSHFASSKAALRTLAQSLAREYGPQGVHVAHIVIDGVINGQLVRGKFGSYLEKLGKDGSLSPEAIADAFWSVHTQHRSAWTHELDLRPFKENW